MNVTGTNDVGAGGTICAERTAIVKSAVGSSLMEIVCCPTSDSLRQSEGKRSFAALAVVT